MRGLPMCAVAWHRGGFAVQEMVEAGKVKHLGVSEMSPADVRKVHKIHPVSLVELEWSLLSRDSEVCPHCMGTI